MYWEKYIKENCIESGTITSIDPTSNIKIGKNFKFIGGVLLIKKNSTFIVGDNVTMMGRIVIEDNSKLFVGNNLSCTNGDLIIRSHESNSIIIGDDCLFADPAIYNSDYHKIISKKDNKILNPGKDVIIGNHVWLALRSMILKGSNIGNGSVVASNSVVTEGNYEDNVILAGQPAKIIKKDIYWEK